jgi:hypothetical protein
LSFSATQRDSFDICLCFFAQTGVQDMFLQQPLLFSKHQQWRFFASASVSLHIRFFVIVD